MSQEKVSAWLATTLGQQEACRRPDKFWEHTNGRETELASRSVAGDSSLCLSVSDHPPVATGFEDESPEFSGSLNEPMDDAMPLGDSHDVVMDGRATLMLSVDRNRPRLSVHSAAEGETSPRSVESSLDLAISEPRTTCKGPEPLSRRSPAPTLDSSLDLAVSDASGAGRAARVSMDHSGRTTHEDSSVDLAVSDDAPHNSPARTVNSSINLAVSDPPSPPRAASLASSIDLSISAPPSPKMVQWTEGDNLPSFLMDEAQETFSPQKTLSLPLESAFTFISQETSAPSQLPDPLEGVQAARNSMGGGTLDPRLLNPTTPTTTVDIRQNDRRTKSQKKASPVVRRSSRNQNKAQKGVSLKRVTLKVTKPTAPNGGTNDTAPPLGPPTEVPYLGPLDAFGPSGHTSSPPGSNGAMLTATTWNGSLTGLADVEKFVQYPPQKPLSRQELLDAHAAIKSTKRKVPYGILAEIMAKKSDKQAQNEYAVFEVFNSAVEDMERIVRDIDADLQAIALLPSRFESSVPR